jgi:hypothetical protein
VIGSDYPAAIAVERRVELNRYAVGGGAFQAVVDPEESR